MSTLLQRMARRARESPLDATPRIEPVLATVFWPGAGTGEDGAIEEHREREMRAPALRETRAAEEATEAHRQTVPYERNESAEAYRVHADETSPVRNVAQESVVVTHATGKAQAAMQVITDGAAQAHLRHDTRSKIEPLLDATPATAAATAAATRESSRNARRSENAAHSGTPERQMAQRPALTLETAAAATDARPIDAPAATPPTITISFGRVEVRQASAPPAPPRAPFRPAVSLDAFLRRGGGNTR
jgi:hypothetical protein